MNTHIDYELCCSYLTQAFIFINEYQWMANSYVAEFFTQDLWNKLPQSWRNCLDRISLDELANNVLLNKKTVIYRSVWPLSLLSYIAACHALSLNHHQKIINKNLCELPEIFHKHIKPKKRHELSLLPQVINNVCKETNSTTVVDVGSGLGHLSRILAYQYGYNVTAIEMTGHRLPVAEKYDKEIEDDLKRKNKISSNVGSVCHVEKCIDPDISAIAFSSLLFNSKSQINETSAREINGFVVSDSCILNNSVSFFKKTENVEHCVLIGLHTCGDLASTMMKVFKSTQSIKGLVSVSCCYMRMSLKEDFINKNFSKQKVGFSITTVDQLLCRTDSFCRSCNSFKKMMAGNALCEYLEKGVFDFSKMESEENILNPGSTLCYINLCRLFSVFTSKSLVSLLKILLSKKYLKTCITDESKKYGFPMSSFLKSIPCQPITYKSLEVACHFIDDYAEKLLCNSPNLKLHCFRAVMEVFIRHVDPKLVLTSARCKKIKGASSMSFHEYAKKVFDNLNISFNSVLLKEINHEELLSQTKRVIIYYSLVLLLGPVIESVVLLDKYAFLKELGVNVSLTPLFNPKISPRNFVLVATR
ncbi:methyltransferase-like protein 25B isoform X2 [Hydra vulgaris]|uniref:methyltransferase-like protein 25B isoform X2 n=1 Tax=Hydra vulgaris TaxID=6087 RepID=UPI000640D41C|nr:methyltransferase-like protein 25B isoform X2 [Hydra vulgaris]